jgi:hypothetical protein
MFSAVDIIGVPFIFANQHLIFLILYRITVSQQGLDESSPRHLPSALLLYFFFENTPVCTRKYAYSTRVG